VNEFAGYVVSAYWGPRKETAPQIAVRCRILLDQLKAISPVLDEWTFLGHKTPPVDRDYDGPEGVAAYVRDHFEAVPQAGLIGAGFVELVAAGVSRADDGEATPVGGYYVSAYTTPRIETSGVALRVHAGNQSTANYYINSVTLTTRPLCAENRSLFEPAVLKAVMLAVASAWDVTWASVYPDAIRQFWPTQRGRPHFRMAWMTYLSARFAPLVTPPPAAIIERPAGGGLLMIATDERFDVANPRHIAAARDIDAAMAPVNALPWPPETAPDEPLG
jgi:hypothetical protein